MDSTSYRLVKIEIETRIESTCERVFEALTKGMNDWWPHRYKDDSEVFCDTRGGGLMGERFSNGGEAIYGCIVYLDPPTKLIASGPSALNNGHSSYVVHTLTQEGSSCVLKRAMSMWGDVPNDVETLFREGSRQIFERALRNYLENGRKYDPSNPMGAVND